MSQNLNAPPSSMPGASTPGSPSCSTCSIPVFNQNLTAAEREAAARYYEMTSRPVPIARRTPVAMYYKPAGQSANPVNGTEQLIQTSFDPTLLVRQQQQQRPAPRMSSYAVPAFLLALAAGAEYAIRRRRQ